MPRERSAGLARVRHPERWLLGFVILQFVCQLALLSQSLNPVRVIFRTAAFGASLALLAFLPKAGPRHPAAKPIIGVLVLLSLSLFHPNTNGWLSGIGHIALNLAVVAPLFWVPSLAIQASLLRRFFMLYWIFHSVGALVGVLQVLYPGRFQPAISTVILDKGEAYLNGLEVTLAGGERILRPMGLTDAPGGAAGSGFYAVLLGACFFLSSRTTLLRIGALASMGMGAFCIYLSQVRVSLVVLAICLIAIAAILLVRAQLGLLLRYSVVISGTLLLSLFVALAIGGDSVERRLQTLIADEPGSVYHRNRGIFLEDTIERLLPNYPLGAGIARWGMVNAYFGDNSHPERAAQHVEIQLTGWALDGGYLLIALYGAALGMTLIMAWRFAVGRRMLVGQEWVWGIALLAYNIGTCALTFGYPVFIGQAGLEFWLLNALVFGVVCRGGGGTPSLRKKG